MYQLEQKITTIASIEITMGKKDKTMNNANKLIGKTFLAQ